MSWSVLGDWGTSRLRLFRIEDGRVTGQASGAGALSARPSMVLGEALAPWMEHAAPDFIHLCGMAGARTGLREAPYASCPAGAAQWRDLALRFEFEGVPTLIAPGVAYTDFERHDVMRGEETQIFGAIALEPALALGDHNFILPGTHSKWVKLQDGAIREFKTFITGELFSQLKQSSLLARVNATEAAFEPEAFAIGFARGRVGGFGALFETRAAQLRGARSPHWAENYLSGCLIGAEFSEMDSMLTGPVILIGAPELCDLYQTCLTDIGVVARTLNGDACVLAGLRQLNVDH